MARMRVLFLCTGNSARSQMAEGLLRKLSRGGADVFSAGTQPRAGVHPVALKTLRRRFDVDTSTLYPKDLNRFIGGEAFDYVITVCDRAAEVCPTLPGDPERIHWGFEDPATVEGEAAQQRAFESVANGIAARLRIWMTLRSVQRRLDEADEATSPNLKKSDD